MSGSEHRGVLKRCGAAFSFLLAWRLCCGSAFAEPAETHELFSRGDSVTVVIGERTLSEIVPGKMLQGRVTRSNRRGLGFKSTRGRRWFVLWEHIYCVNKVRLTDSTDGESDSECYDHGEIEVPDAPQPVEKRAERKEKPPALRERERRRRPRRAFGKARLKQGETEIMGAFTANFPTNNSWLDDEAIYGFGGELRVLYQLTGRLGLGLLASRVDFHGKTRTPPRAELRSHPRTTAFAAAFRFFLFGERIRPYVSGALGGDYFSMDVHRKPANGAVWADTGTTENRRIQRSHSTALYGSGALGLHAALDERITASLEGRYSYFGIDKSAFGHDHFSALSVVAGMGVRF